MMFNTGLADHPKFAGRVMFASHRLRHCLLGLPEKVMASMISPAETARLFDLYRMCSSKWSGTECSLWPASIVATAFTR